VSPAGLAVVKAAKASGAWNAWKQAEEMTIPPDLASAIKANPAASRNWDSYSASRRRAVLYRLTGAKRPETRARYLQAIIENMARNLSAAERREMAGFRPKSKSARSPKR
jgi:uncharacterized protein YdeI (YjbR/CyaY-like superfamily)